jgi:purine-binding chemotaxis protein CheW
MNNGATDAGNGDILEVRAKKLARGKERGHLRQHYITAAVVSIDAEYFGIPVDGLRQIVKAPPISNLPGMPPWLRGIAQVRGELISVVSLARFFKLESSGVSDFLAVVEGKLGAIGLLADTLLGFRDIYADEIAEKFGKNTADDERPIRAITKDLVSIIDLQRLLDDKRLIVDDTP